MTCISLYKIDTYFLTVKPKVKKLKPDIFIFAISTHGRINKEKRYPKVTEEEDDSLNQYRHVLLFSDMNLNPIQNFKYTDEIISKISSWIELKDVPKLFFIQVFCYLIIN